MFVCVLKTFLSFSFPSIEVVAIFAYFLSFSCLNLYSFVVSVLSSCWRCAFWAQTRVLGANIEVILCWLVGIVFVVLFVSVSIECAVALSCVFRD